MTEQDKKIKELLKGSFDESTPSLDFTNNVMDKIASQEALSTYTEFNYVPVISKKGWFIIVSSFLFVVFLSFTDTKKSEFSATNYIPDWNFELSVAHSQLTLIAVMSILCLLIIDRLFMKFRLD